MDGITMGGGVGLSVHGTFRVATERCLFAMPETAIGLFPDVGGSYFLPRLPLGYELGTFLALSGYRLKGEDVFKSGIATHFISSDKIADLEEKIASLSHADEGAIRDILDSFHISSSKAFSLSNHIDDIKEHFSKDDIASIFESLEKSGSEWSLKQLQTMQKMSPTSLMITLEQLKRGRSLDLAECLRMEYRMTQGCMGAKDFYEGIRAVLIDKDHNPKWNPASLQDVDNKDISSYFKPLPAGTEEWSPII
eukprot:UC4_evm1s1108